MKVAEEWTPHTTLKSHIDFVQSSVSKQSDWLDCGFKPENKADDKLEQIENGLQFLDLF